MVRFDEFRLAAAEIDNQTEIERNVGAVGEEGDLLRRAVLKNLEIVLRQIGNQVAGAVVDGKADVDEMNVGAERSVLRKTKRRSQAGYRRRKAHTDILRAVRRGRMQEKAYVEGGGTCILALGSECTVSRVRISSFLSELHALAVSAACVRISFRCAAVTTPAAINTPSMAFNSRRCERRSRNRSLHSAIVARSILRLLKALEMSMPQFRTIEVWLLAQNKR